MRVSKLISAWVEGLTAFSEALAHHQAGRLTPAAIDAATSRLERADRAVRVLPVAAPLRRLQGDVLEGLELAAMVVLLLGDRVAPAVAQAVQADLEEQIRIIAAEAIRQGLAPPLDW